MNSSLWVANYVLCQRNALADLLDAVKELKVVVEENRVVAETIRGIRALDTRASGVG